MTYLPKTPPRLPEYDELETAVRRLQAENRDLIAALRALVRCAYPRTSQDVDALDLALRVLSDK